MAKAAVAGFTLIELMIALAIVAITTSLAVASYRGHVLRGHRVEAAHALLAAAAEQEKFHLAHGRYGERLDGIAGAEPPALPVASSTAHGRYRLAVESADAAGYLLVALPAASDADPLCARFSIDESGRRQARDRDGRDSTGSCW
jgi:type IV pilus assembly protein PilE